MSRIIEEKIDKLKFTGGVDADGHILKRKTCGKSQIQVPDDSDPH
jgi:hypothetical protein